VVSSRDYERACGIEHRGYTNDIRLSEIELKFIWQQIAITTSKKTLNYKRPQDTEFIKYLCACLSR